MIRIFALAATLLAASPCMLAAQTPARAPANLATLFSDEDYPLEAVRNHEQGTVQFRLTVGVDGTATQCAIEATSGSAILDDTTCRLLIERARFEPARDKSGKAVPDDLTGRIVWRLPPAGPPDRADAVFSLWSACLFGEAAKFVPGDLPAADVAARALTSCAALEALAEADFDKSHLAFNRTSLAEGVTRWVSDRRILLQTLPAPEKP